MRATPILLTIILLSGLIPLRGALPTPSLDDVDVSISAVSFNPAANESVTLFYGSLSASPSPSHTRRKSVSTVQVYDPDGGLVRSLTSIQYNPAVPGAVSNTAASSTTIPARQEPRPPGREDFFVHFIKGPPGKDSNAAPGTDESTPIMLPPGIRDMWRVQWDGRDSTGKPVPDEAYTFVIETTVESSDKSADSADGGGAETIVYDPTTFSGGKVGDITDITFDPTGAVSYELPAPARVLFRLGIHNGPMYRTLVDWKPRPAGKVKEYWDGFDRDRILKFRDHENFRALVTYVTLPETTVITYGNKAGTYREYKLGRGKGLPQKPKRSRKPGTEPVFRPDALVPPAWARAPQVTLVFPDHPDPKAIPSISAKIPTIRVRIDVDEKDKPYLMEDQFEVLLFVDGDFFAEAERGYLPLNWKWELQQYPPGEHILTVNISSFKGQAGVASRKVILTKK